MKSDTFVTRLTRGALASTVAGVCLTPQAYSVEAAPPLPNGDVVFNDRANLPEQVSHQEADGALTITLSRVPEEWTKAAEQEFRRLAMVEVKGELTSLQTRRLEELSQWRDQLVNPRTTEEILLQLKRDRLLEKISGALREYVEFQEGASQKRAATR